MLDAIGVGATATLTIEGHTAWKRPFEATAAAQQTQRIHHGGRKRSAGNSEYSTSWVHRVITVNRCKSRAAAIWRRTTWVTFKLALNICGCLFIGFTSQKGPSTLQGVQNKLSSIFAVLISSVPGARQLQIRTGPPMSPGNGRARCTISLLWPWLRH